MYKRQTDKHIIICIVNLIKFIKDAHSEIEYTNVINVAATY